MVHIVLPIVAAKKGKGGRVVEILKPLIEASKKEVGTEAYYFFAKEGEQDFLFGIEQYVSKEALYDDHMKADAFQTLAATMGKEDLLAQELQLGAYEPALGFLTRAGKHGYPAGKFVWIAEFVAKDAAGRDEILKNCKSLVEYVEKQEPTTLSYLFLKDLHNDKRIVVWEQYENKEALTSIHHHSEPFKALGSSIGHLVAHKSTTGYESLGLGFLSK